MRGAIVQRLERHHHLDGRAIRIGDDAALLIERDRLRIDLGHDQRHVLVHAELRGVVDHHRAGLGGTRRMDRRDLGARREQRDVDALEIEGVEIAHLEHRVVAERDLAADRARRGDGMDLGGRKLAFGENTQHLAADIAGGADHRDLESHRLTLHLRLRRECAADLRCHCPDDKSRMSENSLSFAEFWPEYLAAHADPRTRAAHYCGTASGVLLLIAFLAGIGWWLLPAALVAGYGPPGPGTRFSSATVPRRSTTRCGPSSAISACSFSPPPASSAPSASGSACTDPDQPISRRASFSAATTRRAAAAPSWG